jgi:phospholipid/cholesterol/gamma-HCH transport system substrate-binding protein
MATKAQKVRLAVFLLAASCVLAAFLLVAAGVQLLRDRDLYYIDFDASVSGLVVGDAVKYQGIKVGRVVNTSISPDDLQVVVVEISLDPGKAPNVIRDDTQARLYSDGLMGAKYIELVAGSGDAPSLAAGSHISASASFMGNLDERAEVLTAKVERLIDNITVLTSGENSRQLNRILASGSNFMEAADAALRDNRTSLDQTSRNLAHITESLAGSAAALHATMDSLHQIVADGQVRNTVVELGAVIRAVRLQMEGPVPDLLANLNRMAGNIDTTITHVDRTVILSRKDILAAMRNLSEALQNVRQATELIREDPSVLIRGWEQE